MFSHFIYSHQLAIGIGSHVWWSHNPSGHALVFVHGFNGQALGTWSSFPSLLTQQPKCSGWDLIFFGYDGLHTEAVSSAADLSNLLDVISQSPKQLYDKSSASPYSSRQHPVAYKRVVLVAHSLGAVVARRAMLDGYNRSSPAPWATTTDLFAFAPAHNGAKVMSLAMATVGPLASVLSLAQLLNRWIVLRDLEEDSQMLNTLHADLARTYDVSKTKNLRALDTVWARNDRIVTNGALYPDPSPAPSSVLGGRTHSSVCKPDATFLAPVDLLTSRL